jgi:hypothetical protein
VKKNWSSSLLQAKGMGKSTDEGGHFSAVSLSLHYTDTPTYYWVSFGELAGAMSTLGPHVAPSLSGEEGEQRKKKKKKPKR